MTKTISYRGLLLSLLALGVVGTLASGATIAFYGDVERSTGNTFTAGGVELLVDSVSHYNNMICTDTDADGLGDQWQAEAGFIPATDHYPAVGSACAGTWELTDLEDGVHTFFNFADLKPGDFGEDTISLHVYDNPAWGRFLVDNIVDADNTCTDPEQSAEGGACSDPDGDGELDNYLEFTAWLDHGAIAGFQCGEAGPSNAQCDVDPTEGDNAYQDTEAYVVEGATFADFESFEFAPALAAAYSAFGCTEAAGDTEYAACHGLAEDGRMVPFATYYFGLAWDLPLLATGNDAQTDSFQADMVFEVEQHRNNPNPFGGVAAVTDTSTATPAPGATLAVSPVDLTVAIGTQVNFVATVTAEAGFDGSNTVVTVSDAAAGSFFNGTAAGACSNSTVDADNEFAIGANKGICYSNDVAGVYTVTVTLLDQTGGAVVGTPVDVTVTVN